MESVPILGLYGASYLAKMYGLKRVIALDVGGTTAKLGIIHDGEPVYSPTSDLFGIPVSLSLPYLRSIALGGGSVVTTRGDAIELGPESMGSFPGPVCYALGGEKPTLTDAFVTAGLIDPQYFLGGTKTLDLAAAREAIDNHIAKPRGSSVEDGCRAIIERAYDKVADMIATAAQELKQDLSDHTLFAYGGNGGLFACGVAQRAGIRDVALFALGPVFSAFGSSVSDISHVYERSFHLVMSDGADVSRLNRLIDEMRATGMRDLLGEGIKTEGTDSSLELELSQPVMASLTMKSTRTHFDSMEDLRGQLGPDLPAGNAAIELVRLRVKKAITKRSVVPPQREASAGTTLGKRKVAYGSGSGEAQLYEWEALRPSNPIAGCAVLESTSSTYFVPEGWSLEIDSHGNARLSRNPSSSKSAKAQEARPHGR
jgi:acetophenone carboxylase